MHFEMVMKLRTREVVTRSDEIWVLLYEMAAAIGPRSGGVDAPRLSGARGEIEIGVEDGPQVLLRVLSD